MAAAAPITAGQIFAAADNPEGETVFSLRHLAAAAQRGASYRGANKAKQRAAARFKTAYEKLYAAASRKECAP